MTNDEPRPVLAGKVWPFLGFLLVLFLVYIGVRGIIAGVSPASPDPPTGTEEQADSSVKTQIQWRTKYTQCLKAKRMLVPVPIYSGDSDCRAQLETTQQALEGIKAWCDPECPVELEDCRSSLVSPYGPYDHLFY